jgi:hypothetical protein
MRQGGSHYRPRGEAVGKLRSSQKNREPVLTSSRFMLSVPGKKRLLLLVRLFFGLAAFLLGLQPLFLAFGPFRRALHQFRTH